MSDVTDNSTAPTCTLPSAIAGVLSVEDFKRMARRRFQRGSVSLSGKRNPAWVGRWREDEITPDGRVVRVCRTRVLGYKRDIPTKKLALRELETQLARINSPNYRPLRAVTFGEFAEKWQREILTQMKASTQPSTRSQLRRHLTFFNDYALKDIDLSTVQTFVSGLTCAPKSARNLVMTLRSMWNTAKKQGYVPKDSDPFEGLVLPQLEKLTQRSFTATEMSRIIAAAPEPQKTFYWLAGETGMRAGELCGLRWGDVHEDHVRVTRSVWRGRAGRPKTEKSVRSFAISSALHLHLALQRQDPESLVFSTKNGTPWDAGLLVKRKLHPLLRRLGIAPAGLHAFRHGNETFMDQQSTPTAVRLNRLGHADVRMMANYSHPIGDDDRQVARELGELLAPKCAENENRLPEADPIALQIQ